MMKEAEEWRQTTVCRRCAVALILVSVALATVFAAGTATASYHTDDRDEAEVEIEASSISSPITAGETLEVAIEYSNRGNVTVSDTLELTVDEERHDTAEVTVESGETVEVTLTWETQPEDQGSHEISILTEHAERRTETVQVEAKDASTPFAGTIRLVQCNPDCNGDPIFLSSSENTSTESVTIAFDEMIRTEALAPPEDDDQAKELEADEGYHPPEINQSKVASYQWRIDGEVVGTGNSVEQTYDEPREYELALVALDEEGDEIGRSIGVVEFVEESSPDSNRTEDEVEVSDEAIGDRDAHNVEINATVRDGTHYFRPSDVFSVYEYRLDGELVARTASEKPQYGIVRATGESSDDGDSEAAVSYYYVRRRGEELSNGGSDDESSYVEVPAKKVVKFKPGVSISVLVSTENEDGERVLGWQSVTIPGKSVEQDSYREGDEAEYEKKLGGQTSFDDLEMERGVKPGDTKLHDWFEDVRASVVSSTQEVKQTLEDCEADVCREVAASADVREEHANAAAEAATNGDQQAVNESLTEIQQIVEGDVRRLEEALQRDHLDDRKQVNLQQALELERELLEDLEVWTAPGAGVNAIDPETVDDIEAGAIGPNDDPEEDCPVLCAVEGEETAQLHVNGTHLATATRGDVRAGKADSARKEIAVVNVTGPNESRLTKAELIDSIASEADVTKADGKKALDAFIDTTTKALLAGGDGDQERGSAVDILEVTNEGRTAGTVVTGQIEQGVREGGTVAVDPSSEVEAVDRHGPMKTGRFALKKGNRVSLVGFGSFSVSKRSARKGRNPQTGKEIKIPAAVGGDSDFGDGATIEGEDLSPSGRSSGDSGEGFGTLLSIYGESVESTALEDAVVYAEQTSYEWRVDGEVVSEGPSLDHEFESSGDHQVELTVTEPDGTSYSMRRNVTVSQAQIADDGDDADGGDGDDGEGMPGFGVLAALAATGFVAVGHRLVLLEG